MAIIDPSKSPLMEKCAAFVIVSITFLFGWVVIAPYFGYTLSQADLTLVSSVQNTLQNVFLLIMGFLFGSAMKNQAKDDTIASLTATVAAAAAPNGPTGPAPLVNSSTNGAPTT